MSSKSRWACGQCQRWRIFGVRELSTQIWSNWWTYDSRRSWSASAAITPCRFINVGWKFERIFWLMLLAGERRGTIGGRMSNSNAVCAIASVSQPSELTTTTETLPTCFNARAMCKARSCPPKLRLHGQQGLIKRMLGNVKPECKFKRGALRSMLSSPSFYFKLATIWQEGHTRRFACQTL